MSADPRTGHGCQFRGSSEELPNNRQGGLLNGSDPTEYNTHDPIRLLLSSSLFARGHYAHDPGAVSVSRTNQTAKSHCRSTRGNHTGSDGYGPYSWLYGTHFPEPSRPFLALVANIGLVLFLFLVGLEIDVAVIKRNAKTSLTISTGGMILPFGLGAAVAIPVYNNFIDPEAASFGHFLLFVGVAFSITAFPVLCRILVALELLDTTVGIVVLSAGVGNDVVGWTLLALTVALVNASTGLTALYVLLCAVGWALFILYPVKRAMVWLARWTGSVESGPSPLFMTVTILLVFGARSLPISLVSHTISTLDYCANSDLGVHAIFGGFLAGLAIPHEGGLAIALTEKLEDMVSIISSCRSTLPFLDFPLILACWTMASHGDTPFSSVLPLYWKFFGGALAARFAGFTTREAATIGTLMSCKGLVELIVLNVGLSAGILSTRVSRSTAIGGNFGHASDNEIAHRPSNDGILNLAGKKKFLFCRTRGRSPDTKVEIPGSPGSSNIAELPAEEPLSPRGVTIDALRLLELTERTSAIMLFRTFAELEDIPVASSLSVVSHEGFATSVTEHSVKNGDEMVVVSWTPGTSQTTAHGQSVAPTPAAQTVPNPFDTLFKTTGVNETAASSGIHSHFLRGLFVKSSVDVALFIDRGPGGQSLGGTGGVQHLFLPFFGGPDDRLALSFVAQLCKHPLVSATVVRVRKTEPEDADIAIPEAAHVANAGQAEAVAAAMKANNMTIHSTAGGFPDTVYAAADTQTRLASDTLDDIIWTRCNNELGSSNVAFKTISTPTPLRSIVSLVHTLVPQDEMKEFGASGEMGKTAGDVAAALFVSDIKGPIVVLQAAYASRRDEHE
ncbi:Sodium/hydrogen exchanger family [Rhizoctonia solani]|uniref:Sodium/hydrogen exchanger family n=1 Tax=Rhizoctonia solani TaxID=456999 RepID=A0A8H7ICS8_9AGAM|nr:Sodium/hydrogen exchanger family [Rhizoctonia solani]